MPHPGIDVRQKTLHEWLQDGESHDLQLTLSKIREAQQLFHQECADRLRRPVNEYLSTLPSQTTEQKRAICKWLNATLGSVHLGVLCPKTGNVGILVCDQGYDANRGRFQIRLYQSPGIKRAPVSSVTLPDLLFGIRDNYGRVLPAPDSRSR
jgi:hypothetical protein